MGRYKSVFMAEQDARRFAYAVDIAVPGNGLGKQLDAMYAHCRAKCGSAWANHGKTVKGRHVSRTYFHEAAQAQAFIEEFGGELIDNRENLKARQI